MSIRRRSLISRTTRTPDLVLVLPKDLNESETLTDLAEAIGQFRKILTDRVDHLTRASQRLQGGKADLADLRGQLDAYTEAVAHLDEEIITRFDLWDQYARWSRSRTDRRERTFIERSRLF
ncbi:hypothetical protein SAMN04489712_105472 [Thermomonospora echinospora]|uniref:Uncharacterized protein n=1 Tax=Thermomonospora echinospora TaxID=1992 RepID=A0A1H6AJ13_9ACTN|nr:hypothetical protein [Thermomonospora echinospora]SEG48382.1 hypothetical protein SAMN04489712_105472 [Thermomonospora echinospora]